MPPPWTARELPRELGSTFRVRDALDDSEVTEARLRALDLDSGVWGMRSTRDLSGDLRGRCELFAARLDQRSFYSHATAALLLGIVLPRDIAACSDLHISLPAPHRAPHSAGLIGHQLRVGAGDVVVRDGLRLTSPARTWRDLAGMLSVPDLVAAGDRILWRKRPLATREHLQRSLPTTPVRGSKNLRLALPMLTDRADSAPESIVRTALVLAGMLAPEPNHEVPDPAVRHSWWVDLAYPELRFAIEYQGDHHRDVAQWRRDLRRRARLEALGWQVLELTGDDLRDPDALIRLIQERISRLSVRA